MAPDLFKSFCVYLRFRFTNFLTRNPANKPIVVVQLDSQFPDIPDGRYFYLILRTFLESGYYLQLARKMSFRDFRGLKKYEKYFLRLKDMQIVSACPPASESTILVTNSISQSEAGWKKVVQLEADALAAGRNDGDLFMPYFMHPVQYQCEARNQLDALRRTPRRVRIFFSGNVSEKDYENALPGNKLTRSEIVQSIQGMPGVEYVRDEQHFREILSQRSFTNACVINDRFVYAVPDKEWLRALALGDFFLSLPGSRMPLCHNAIEAMAVGAIPILNYSEWFDPKLEHGKNCIEFGTLSELRDRLTEILSWDSEAVQAMRQRVIDYYEENLTPFSFRKRLEKSPDHRVRLFVNTEQPYTHKGSRSIETQPEQFNEALNLARLPG